MSKFEAYQCPKCGFEGYVSLDKHKPDDPWCKVRQGIPCDHPVEFRMQAHNGQNLCRVCWSFEPGIWTGEWSDKPFEAKYPNVTPDENVNAPEYNLTTEGWDFAKK